MSSLTGGYDLFGQISAAAILQLLQAQAPLPKLGLKNLTTPCTISASSQAGAIALNVNAFAITLAQDKITLTASFDKSTLIVNGVSSAVAGTMALTFPFLLVDVPATSKLAAGKQLRLSVDNADVSFQLSSTSGNDMTWIADTLGSVATDSLHKEQPIDLPVRFAVTPGQGNLLAFQFSTLEMHTLESSKSIGIFGNFGGGGGSVGDVSGSLLKGDEGLGLALSASAFQSQVLCPQVAKALNVGVAQLPGNCGNGTPTLMDGIQLNRFQTSFTQGSLQVEIALSKETSKYSMHAKAHGSATLDIQGDTVQPRFVWSDPDVDTELKGWAKLISYVIPVVAVYAGVVSLVVDAIISSFGKKLLTGISNQVVPLDLANLARVPFEIGHADVLADGLSIGGSLLVKDGIHEIASSFIKGSSDVEPIGDGVQEPVQPPIPVPSQTYMATEFACNTTAMYEMVPVLIPAPYKLEWSITTNDGQEVHIPGSGGAVPLPNMSATFNAGNGASLAITRNVTVNVAVNGNGIVLKNNPEEGNYSFPLTARVTQPDGKVRTTFTVVDMTGNMLVMPPEYEAALKAWEDRMKRIGAGRAVATPHKPNPGDIRQMLQASLSDPSPEVASWMTSVQLLSSSPVTRSIDAISTNLAIGQIDAGRIDPGRIDLGRIDQSRIDLGRIDTGAINAGKLDVDAGKIGNILKRGR